MKSSKRIRRALVLGATTITAAATIAIGATALAAAQPSSHQGQAHANYSGPGYPKPGGIYKPFTNCPLLNSLMQESTPASATGCVAGVATTGTIKIGNITTPVTHKVYVQFGIWDPVNATPSQWIGGVLPPPNGLAAQQLSQPEYVKGGLLKALGCPGTLPTIVKLCAEATKVGGKDKLLYAQAETAGPITNFDLTTWTQPLMFRLINPLLGANCFIGSTDNPVMVNPSLSLSATGKTLIEADPNPTAHPDTDVIKIQGAIASDTTFTAPGVTGCGPGRWANIAVDGAIDTSAGLPAATGTNSLTLDGNFYLAATYAPHNMANILLSAFKASVGTKATARNEVSHPISFASLRGHYGFKHLTK
jgi:hypothetical protein